MGRILRKVLTATAIIMALYIGAQYWLGTRLEQEVQAWADDLAAQPDVELRLLEYDRQLATGTLHYDLTINTRSPLLEPHFALLQVLAPDEEITLQGSADVSHGPWFANQGVGIAEASWLLEPTGDLRSSLPDHPAQTPLAQIKLLLGFGDRLRLDVDVADYDGRLLDVATSDVARLKVTGLRGHLASNHQVSRVTSEMNLDEFTLSQVDSGELVTIAAAGIRMEGAWQQEDGLWTGESESRTRQASLTSPGARYRMSDARQHSAIHHDDGIVQIDQQLVIGEIQSDLGSLEQIELFTAIGGVDAAAYLAIVTDSEAQDEQAWIQAMEALLAAEPWLAINRFSVALDEEEDILLTARAEIVGARTLEDLPEATRVNGELTVGTNVIREIMRYAVLGDDIAGLSAEEQDAAVDEAYQQFMQSLALFPQLEITDRYVHGSASVERGNLTVGGQSVLDLSGLFSSEALSDESQPDNDVWSGFDDVTLDTSVAPLYGRFTLSGGFDPDPHITEMTAGGPDWLDGSSIGQPGNCIGYVNAERPDLTVAYQAAGNALHIFVVSDEDTTLIVHTPDGQWHCNDDAPGFGLDPGLSFEQALDGDYLIWVGTFTDDLAHAEIQVSGQSRQAAQ